ncbi:MAG TPA: hypothetical protein VN922_14770, partial [Bacteroidia bacterium]|nr:hypothetical protein [Bacteroidia bacterium]
ITANVTATGTISVTASNSCGSNTSSVFTVTLGGSVATATPGSNTPVCGGTTINLTAGPGGTAPYTYTWQGLGAVAGFSSTLQNPSTTALTPAVTTTYTFQVKVTNACGNSGFVNDIVVVKPSPATPTPTATPAGVCIGATLSLNAGGVLANYSWTGPNGFTSSVQNPTISPVVAADAGTYSLTTTSAGCTSAAGTTATVVVNPLPPIASGISAVVTGSTSYPATSYSDPCGGSQIAVGQSVTYLANAAPGGVTYTWSATGGTVSPSTGNWTVVTWTGSGSETITVTASYTTGCTSTSTFTQNVLATALCSYSSCGATSNYVVPSGVTTLTVSLFGASGGGAYADGSTWYTAGQFDGYGANIVGTYTTTGGTTLNLNIGCKGGDGTSSKAGTGGKGGNNDENGGAGYYNSNPALFSAIGGGLDVNLGGGGGGGGTDFRVGGNAFANIIAVAGGGGGSDAEELQVFTDNGRGNDGNIQTWVGDFMIPNLGNGATSLGNLNGENGSYWNTASDGGRGGTTAAAGAAVTGSDYASSTSTACMPNNPCASIAGDAHCSGGTSQAGGIGSNGNGGNASYCTLYAPQYPSCSYSAGGGGGGGYYGASGGAGGSGGGGSSYAKAGSFTVTSVTPEGNSSSGVYGGNGYIIVTW